jgi:hypothetical protein
VPLPRNSAIGKKRRLPPNGTRGRSRHRSPTTEAPTPRQSLLSPHERIRL